MKSIVYYENGPADVLRLEEIAKPSPKDDQVLVRVRAGAVNPLDWRLMRGVPILSVAGLTALQGLRDVGRMRVGHAVLVNGAAGGVGTFAVQIARVLGAEVTGVLAASRRVVKPGGAYVIAGGPKDAWAIVGRMFRVMLLSPFVRPRMASFMAKRSAADLGLIGEWIASGKVTPVIERRYILSDVPAAIRHVEEGHARGKVVITVA